ncbi:glycosyltransferase [Pseudomonas sp. CAM1A]|uniref:glycosyltransferase n=1 Tax=Pseudomonas sp. CAM1A TaxID=3231717 RepID=UPI0039C709CF
MVATFSSASDVLRYPMLHSEGGIYMDVDDTLLAVGEHPYKINGRPVGSPDEAIGQVELSINDEGLLLFPPMSNEKLGMNCQFNTSLIGSHAGNPTLLAIREEMRSRYLVEPEFYGNRPGLRDDQTGFYRYAASLNRLTGPGLLTDVVDQHLPLLKTLRHITNLF